MSVTEVFPPIPSNKSSAAVDGLKGNALLSGLKITPSGLYFGAVVIGEDPLIQSVTIENQGRKALRIEEFFLEVGSDKFTLIGSAPDILKGGESFSVQVAYASNTIGTFNGLIVLRTSEKENNQYNIGLSGRVIGTTFLESMTEDFTAMVLEERFARTTADMAEAGHRLTLEASMISEFAETNAKIVQEQIARVTAIEAEAMTREQLEVSMNTQFFDANATIEAHRLARVNADEALAQSIEDLDAVFLTEGQVQTIANAAVHIESEARADADGALARRIESIEANYETVGEAYVNAKVLEESEARADADEALATRTVVLEAHFDQGGTVDTKISAKVSEESLARSTADEALATRIETIEADYETAGEVTSKVNAKVAEESLARANADEALATRSTTLEAHFDTGGTVDTRISAKVSDEASARSDADGALSTRISSIEADYQTSGQVTAKVNAKVADEAQVRADADGALATRTSTLEGHFGTNGLVNTRIAAKVGDEATVRANADGALATRAETLEAHFAVGGTVDTRISAKVSDEAEARADADGALAGRISTLEATSGTGVDSVARASIVDEATTRANADGALATRSSTLEARTLLAWPNRILNGDFGDGLRNWTIHTGVWTPAESAWLGTYAGGNASTSLHMSQEFSVEAGNSLFISAEAVSNGAAYVQIETMNGPKQYSQPLYLNNPDYNRRGSTIGFVIPVGCTVARLNIFKNSGDGDNVNITRVAVQANGWTIWRNDKSVANIAARITTEETARADSDGALAQRSTNLETRMNGAEGRLTVTESVATDAYGRSRAFLKQEAVAGSGRAQIKLWADSVLGGGVDIIGDVAIHGNLIVDGTIYNSKLPNEVVDYSKLGITSKGQTIIRKPAGPGAGPYFSPAVGEQLEVDAFNITFSYPVWVIGLIGMAFEKASGSFDGAISGEAKLSIYKNGGAAPGEYAWTAGIQWQNALATLETHSRTMSTTSFLPAGDYTIRLYCSRRNTNGRFLNGWNNLSILWGPS